MNALSTFKLLFQWLSKFLHLTVSASSPSHPHCHLSPCILLAFDHYNCSDVLCNSVWMFALSNLFHFPAGSNSIFFSFSVRLVCIACAQRPFNTGSVRWQRKEEQSILPMFHKLQPVIGCWVAFSVSNKPIDWGKRKCFCLLILRFSVWVNTVTWLEVKVLSVSIKLERNVTTFVGTLLSLFLCYLTTSSLSLRNSASFLLLYSVTNAWCNPAGETVRTLTTVDGRGLILEKVEQNDQHFWVHVY